MTVCIKLSIYILFIKTVVSVRVSKPAGVKQGQGGRGIGAPGRAAAQFGAGINFDHDELGCRLLLQPHRTRKLITTAKYLLLEDCGSPQCGPMYRTRVNMESTPGDAWQ